MMINNKSSILIVLSVLILISCKSSPFIVLEGSWVINEFKYDNQPVEFKNITPKIELVPIGYSDKRTLEFKKDSTCIMPGINTDDIILKWKLISDTLLLIEDTVLTNVILFDSIEHLNSTLFEGENIQENKAKYKRLKDSIVQNKNHHPYIKALKVYTGKYIITRVNDSHINLDSEHSKIRLLDIDKEMNKRKSDLLR